jgi:hypothetical protein
MKEIPPQFMVEGIRAMDQHAVANRSSLLKPESFDTSKYAAKWALVGASADAARLPQPLIPGYTVDGWEIWKDPETNQPCTRPLGGKQAILMFRSKALQKAVNAIHGNTSKERAVDEQQGRTVQGQTVPQGLLSNERLKGYDPGAEAAETAPIPYTLNSIPTQESVVAGAASRRPEIRAKGSRPRAKKVAA